MKNTKKMFILIGLSILTASCESINSKNNDDVSFYNKAIEKIQDCLDSGRNCGLEKVNNSYPEILKARTDCFENIKYIKMNIIDTEARLSLLCSIKNKLVLIEAISDRQKKANHITDPIVSSRLQ